MLHTEKYQIGCRSIQEDKARKYGNNTPGVVEEQKIIVNVGYASCSLIMGIPTK